MINLWHSLLRMVKYGKAWHKQDLADELAEYNEETNLFMKWSELSDVVYTCTRARWSGHNIKFPLSKVKFWVGVLYMIPKYTGRWLFFNRAGRKCGTKKPIHEVRNPKKVHKLHIIAERYKIDKKQFQKTCEKQLRYWPLLP